VAVPASFVVEVNVTEIVVLVWMFSKRLAVRGTSLCEIGYVSPTKVIVIFHELRSCLMPRHCSVQFGYCRLSEPRCWLVSGVVRVVVVKVGVVAVNATVVVGVGVAEVAVVEAVGMAVAVWYPPHKSDALLLPFLLPPRSLRGKARGSRRVSLQHDGLVLQENDRIAGTLDIPA
jgi:hypothetical protein